MFERVESAAYTIGALTPWWWLAILAGTVVVVCALVMLGHRARQVLRIAMVLILGLSGWWLLDQVSRQERAAERRALEWRSAELATRALMPGSALACLDAIAGDAVEDACERALFARPEATAAAVAYVGAQLSLLASAGIRGERELRSAAMASVRRAIEIDRFGIAAHVLATREGCTADRCASYALLQDASGVRANLAERAFEARVRKHMAAWLTADNPSPAAASLPAGSKPPGTTAKSPNNLYFPSAASIPPVNIMTTESDPSPPSHGRAAGAAETAPARKPAVAPPPRVAPASGSAARGSAPMPLVPDAR
jgi:hypothetical protein